MLPAATVLLTLLSVIPSPAAAPPPPSSQAHPLLVIVERTRGATRSPESIRNAIAHELGRPVIGPQEAGGDEPREMLIVSVGPDSVAMQLRTTGDGAPRRRVEPLPGGDSGLRVVAWLAGNMARDETRDLLEPQRPRAISDARLAMAAPAAPAENPAVAPENPARTEPPPLAVTAVPQASLAAQPTSGSAAVSAGAVPWRVGLSVGKATEPGHFSLMEGSITRLEVLPPTRPGQWTWDAAIELIRYSESSSSRDYLLTAGLHRRLALAGGWLAADLGGMAILAFTRMYFVQPTTTVAGQSTATVSQETLGPEVLGRLVGSIIVTPGRFGEIVLGANVNSLLDDLAQWPLFMFTGGVRIAIP